MEHGESRTNKPPYQAIKTNYKLLRSKMRWFSNWSTWNDPIDVTVKYNIEKRMLFKITIFQSVI